MFDPGAGQNACANRYPTRIFSFYCFDPVAHVYSFLFIHRTVGSQQIQRQQVKPFNSDLRWPEGGFDVLDALGAE